MLYNVPPEWVGTVVGRSRDFAGHVAAGRLVLQTAEADDESVLRAQQGHETACYFPDGSAKKGLGAAAFARFAAGTLKALRASVLRCVADPFLPEQRGLLMVLEDAEGRRGDVWVGTDSQSNVASLLAVGPRDPVEDKIIRKLVSICNQGRKVSVCFVRSHKGLLGNELADGAAKHRRHTAGGKVPAKEKEIAPNLVVSRLKEWARRTLKGKVESAAEAGHKTARALVAAGGLEQENPMTHETGKMSASRREGIILSQLRTGVSTFACGFRTDPKSEAVCETCKGTFSSAHFLYGCRAHAEHRPDLERAILKERELEREERIERDLWNGRVPNMAPVGQKFGLRDIGARPQAVLDYIKKCDTWLDRNLPDRGAGGQSAPVPMKQAAAAATE